MSQLSGFFMACSYAVIPQASVNQVLTIMLPPLQRATTLPLTSTLTYAQGAGKTAAAAIAAAGLILSGGQASGKRRRTGAAGRQCAGPCLQPAVGAADPGLAVRRHAVGGVGGRPAPAQLAAGLVVAGTQLASRIRTSIAAGRGSGYTDNPTCAQEHIRGSCLAHRWDAKCAFCELVLGMLTRGTMRRNAIPSITYCAGAVDDSAVERSSPAVSMWQAGPPPLRSNSEDGSNASAALHSSAGHGFRSRGFPPPIRQSSDGAATSAAYDAWRRGSPQPCAGTNFHDDGGSSPMPAVGRGMAGGDDAAHAALADELYRAGLGFNPNPSPNPTRTGRLQFVAEPATQRRPLHLPAPLQLNVAPQQRSDIWADGRYGSGLSSGSTPGLSSVEDGFGCGGHLGAESFLRGSTPMTQQPCSSLLQFGYCRDGTACAYSHTWDVAPRLGPAPSPCGGHSMLMQQPQRSPGSFMLASPSPTSSLLSLDSPARPYGSPSPSPQPAPMLVSQDSVGFAFGAPGSAAFSATAGLRVGQASPSPQQHSLARAAFANAVAAQQYATNGAGTVSDQRVHDPRLVRAALDPGNTFVGAAQSMFDGGGSSHDASFRSVGFDEHRLV